MSEEFKKKLYNYEDNPPETVWNKIAASLNDEVHAGFPKKLYEFEAPPPENTWIKIADELENNLPEFSAKRYNLELAPPAASWEKINASLNTDSPNPSKVRSIPFIRYAAAACIIGLITFGAIKLFNRNVTGNSVAVKTVPQNPKTTPPDNQNKSSSEITQPASNNLPKERKYIAKASVSKKGGQLQQEGYMTQIVNPAINDQGSLRNDFQQAILRGNIPGSHSLVSDKDPYLLFLNPDGYLIRISKKLAETLGCVYTKGNSEEYKRCEDQIKKWRDKIAQSPASSSPDNFMDIVNIIKSVQDN